MCVRVVLRCSTQLIVLRAAAPMCVLVLLAISSVLKVELDCTSSWEEVVYSCSELTWVSGKICGSSSKLFYMLLQATKA